MKVRLSLSLVLFALAVPAADYTSALQARIDAMSKAGGGVIRVGEGRHVIRTLYLKSGVTLEIPDGAILEGSPNPADYPDVRIEYAELREPWQGLIVAENQHDVAVIGGGIIFGNGAAFPHGTRLGRPQGLLFHRCRNVRIEGVYLRDLARWTCYLKECDGVVVRRIKVDSHANANNDGIDIDSRNVLVEDCDFDSDDDGIVFKSDNADFIVENVTVTNCRVRSTCSTVKFGTGSHGGFRNIRVEHIRGDASTREWCDPKTGKGVISTYRVETWPGSTFEPSPLSAVAIECVDGGLIENLVLKDIIVERAATPIFIRGGLRRNRVFGHDGQPLGLPFGRSARVENVLIDGFSCKATSFTASSITGVPGLELKGIKLQNVTIFAPGAGDAALAEIGKAVPEKIGDYPESNMFDHRMLPAYGFFIRHADVTLENVMVTLLSDDPRPEILRE